MRGVLRDGTVVTALYVLVVWIALALGAGPLTRLFGLEGVAADLFGFFCLVSGGVWFFTGLLFLANASFNNLGFPFYSTALNWGRATLGVAPAWLAAPYFGAKGVLAGYGLGVVVFGVVGVWLCFRVLAKLETGSRSPANIHQSNQSSD